MSQQSEPPKRLGRYTLIPFVEAARQTHNSINNYRRLAAIGLLPKPIKVGKKKIAVVQEELDEAIARQIAQRDREQCDSSKKDR
jgi:hypothetical protein